MATYKDTIMIRTGSVERAVEVIVDFPLAWSVQSKRCASANVPNRGGAHPGIMITRRMTMGLGMWKLLALMVLLCGAASADAAEKSDHWLLVLLDSEGRPQYGDQMVPSETCDSVAKIFAKAQAEKKRFKVKLSTKPNVAGEVLAAVCITPNGGIDFLTPTSVKSKKGDYFTGFSKYINQRVSELSKKP